LSAVVILRTSQRDRLDRLTLGQRERRRPPTGVLRVQRLEGVVVEVVSTARTRSSEMNTTLAIYLTSIAWADSNTICARRHVTTDPDDRRTILRSRWPSSFLISPDPDAFSHHNLIEQQRCSS
jgi:hypothetical protein